MIIQQSVYELNLHIYFTLIIIFACSIMIEIFYLFCV